MEEALKRISEVDETTAGRAYACLLDFYRPRLVRYLLKTGGRFEMAEDAVQETFTWLWNARAGIRDEGRVKFGALLKQVAKHRFIDLIRNRDEASKDLELIDKEIPPEELPLIEEIRMAILTGRLYLCANALWLGLDPQLLPDTYERQLLAAQLYYLEGETVEDILHTLASPPPGEPPLTLKQLRDWLHDPGVLRYLAYRTLYYSNDRLAAWMLGLGDAGEEEIAPDELMRSLADHLPEERAFGEWTWGQVAVVLWRYRYALTLDQIVQRWESLKQPNEPLSDRDDRQEIAALIETLKARFPFEAQMRRLLAELGRRPALDARALLSEHRLWERLVFQYEYHDDIPLLDIVERTAPAAQCVEFLINKGTLNIWTSGKRLRNKLIRYWKEAFGGDFDE